MTFNPKATKRKKIEKQYSKLVSNYGNGPARIIYKTFIRRDIMEPKNLPKIFLEDKEFAIIVACHNKRGIKYFKDLVKDSEVFIHFVFDHKFTRSKNAPILLPHLNYSIKFEELDICNFVSDDNRDDAKWWCNVVLSFYEKRNLSLLIEKIPENIKNQSDFWLALIERDFDYVYHFDRVMFKNENLVRYIEVYTGHNINMIQHHNWFDKEYLKDLHAKVLLSFLFCLSSKNIQISRLCITEIFDNFKSIK